MANSCRYFHICADHENAMVRDGMQNVLDDSIDDNEEEEMDEDNGNDEHGQQEVEQQPPGMRAFVFIYSFCSASAVIGRERIKYGRSRSNRTSATIACKKCGNILKNDRMCLYNHAADHLDDASFRCCLIHIARWAPPIQAGEGEQEKECCIVIISVCVCDSVRKKITVESQ